MTGAAAATVPGPEAWGEARHRTITWWPPRGADEAAGRTGLEFLRALADGELAPPPMASVFGLRLVELERGRVVFECEPDESCYNPMGVAHGGLVSTLADTVLGCAAHSTLPAGASYSTIELSISFLRPVTTSSGVLRGTGTVTKAGRRVAFAAATVLDGTRREVATATSSLLVIGA